MNDDPKTPPEPTLITEMPSVLISNHIQQLNDNMNHRFNDERIRSDRFDTQERLFNERFAALTLIIGVLLGHSSGL